MPEKVSLSRLSVDWAAIKHQEGPQIPDMQTDGSSSSFNIVIILCNFVTLDLEFPRSEEAMICTALASLITSDLRIGGMVVVSQIGRG